MGAILQILWENKMSILLDENTKVCVQGITGSEGSFHTRQMIEYGTNVVAGVTPGKGGTDFDGVPIYNTVADAVKEKGVEASAIFVPPPFAADAILSCKRRRKACYLYNGRYSRC